MASTWTMQHEPVGVVDKILRRAEVAKMARLLQTRLAVANFKTKHGWANLDLDTIEPKVEMELKRKRPSSSGETVSDSSSTSESYYPSNAIISSSPSTAALFSDDLQRSGGMSDSRKRTKRPQPFQHPGSTPTGPNRSRSTTTTAAAKANARGPRAAWKDVHQLSQSSPAFVRQPFPYAAASDAPAPSFASEASTVAHDAPAPKASSASDDTERDRGLEPGSGSSQLHSSPPRTPPPSRVRSNHLQSTEFSSSVSHNPATGEEGADLLLFLATSPSPANPAVKARIVPPSTPPSRNLALPSSMMTTPSGGAFLGGLGGPNTPSQGFNFADFVNITPSPAQGAWSNRTPATAKTPLAAREARRRLNFDALVPPTGSPTLSALSSGASKQSGLGMELGGELVS